MVSLFWSIFIYISPDIDSLAALRLSEGVLADVGASTIVSSGRYDERQAKKNGSPSSCNVSVTNESEALMKLRQLMFPQRSAKPGSDKPRAIFMVGAPGSGKSAAQQLCMDKTPDRHYTVLDPDDILVQVFQSNNGCYWVDAWHNASSGDVAAANATKRYDVFMLNQEHLQICLAEKRDFVFDSTGRNLKFYQQLAARVVNEGFEVTLCIARTKFDLARGRAESRAQEMALHHPNQRARTVDVDFLVDTADQIELQMEEYMHMANVDHIYIYNNNGRSAQEVLTKDFGQVTHSDFAVPEFTQMSASPWAIRFIEKLKFQVKIPSTKDPLDYFCTSCVVVDSTCTRCVNEPASVTGLSRLSWSILEKRLPLTNSSQRYVKLLEQDQFDSSIRFLQNSMASDVQQYYVHAPTLPAGDKVAVIHAFGPDFRDAVHVGKEHWMGFTKLWWTYRAVISSFLNYCADCQYFGCAQNSSWHSNRLSLVMPVIAGGAKSGRLKLFAKVPIYTIHALAEAFGSFSRSDALDDLYEFQQSELGLIGHVIVNLAHSSELPQMEAARKLWLHRAKEFNSNSPGS